MQEDTPHGKKSVFQRLNGVKGNSALQSRLSKPSSMEPDSRPSRRPVNRPINDARNLLVETVAAKVWLPLINVIPLRREMLLLHPDDIRLQTSVCCKCQSTDSLLICASL